MTRYSSFLLLLAGALLTAVACGGGSSAADRSGTPSPTVSPVPSVEPSATVETPRRARPVGDTLVLENRLVDDAGSPLVLRGVTQAGTEYACAQGWGVFDPAGTREAAEAIAAWGANAARVPLNEHCWLGRNGLDGQFGGGQYRGAIEEWVAHLRDAGLAVILALEWSGPGTTAANAAAPMPNSDHSADFWSSVAETFSDVPGVLFELYAQPHDVNWDCWRDGCVLDGRSFIGMQQLVDTVRSTGATAPIILPGLGYGTNLTQWEAHIPLDPQRAVVAGFASASWGACADEQCWSSALAPLLPRHPMVMTSLSDEGCSGPYLQASIAWAEDRGVSWLANPFNAWDDPCALLADSGGEPTELGASIQAAMASDGTAYLRFASVPGLRVDGNQLVDDLGAPFHLRGVNRAGTEYACAQGWGVFDTTGDASTAAAIASWGANSVRVPLNEHCWLGRNGVALELSGDAYQEAIREWVDALHGAGLVAVLALMWSAPGDSLALGQAPMANGDHSLDFWRSVAAEYRGLPGVMFDLYGEPNHISWQCWQNGECEFGGGAATSMQEMVDVIRAEGAQQPVIVSGIDFANDLSEWLARRPSDPAEQLVAGFHVYDFTRCSSVACWERTLAPIAESFPVITAELGQSGCGSTFVRDYLEWARDRGISWLAWGFNDWETVNCDPRSGATDQTSCTLTPQFPDGCALVVDEQGTPGIYGQEVRDLLGREASAP